MAQQNIEIKLSLNTQKLNAGLKTSKGDFTKMADEIQASLNRLRNVTKNGIMKDAFKDAIADARKVRDELRALAKAETVSPARSLSVQAKAFAVKDTMATAGSKALYEQNAAAVNKLTVAQNEAIVAAGKYDKSQRGLTAAAKEQIQVQNQMHQSWITGRYALYDVASAANQASQNFLNFTKVVYEAQFAQEKAFSQVQKTQIGTDPKQLDNLKNQLIDLTKQIPKSFEEISKIAMLGSQLGIATGNIAEFADTVAKFSTITGVTIDETANSFGKLANLLKVPASQYKELGSSIAFVGVQAAATENEILSTAKQIASVANNAGFTADQVIGLSSALASLATRPEEARGVLVPTFQAMDAAVRSFSEQTKSGNESLAVFAATAGMSAEEFSNAWSDKKSGGAAKAFQSFITGLGKADTGKVLDQLGLAGVRTSKGLTALGNNAEEVGRQIAAATAGMVAGDFLDKSFATTVDDIAVKIQLLGAAVQELMAASASNPQILGFIGIIVDGMKEIVSNTSDFTKGPFVSFIAGLSLAFVALTGVILGIGAAVSTGIAAVYALRTAFVALEAAGFAGKIMNIGAALLKLPEATAAATAGVQRFGAALKWTAIGLAASAVVAVVVDSLIRLQDEAKSTADSVNESFGDLTGLRDAMDIDTSKLTGGGTAIATFTTKSATMTQEMIDATRKADDLAEVLGNVGVAADVASSKTESSSVAFGESALNFTRAWLVTTDGFKKALEDPNFSAYFNAIGANIDTVLAIAAKDGEQAVMQYFYDLKVAAQKAGKDLPQLSNLAAFDPIAAISGTSEYVDGIEMIVKELKLVKPAATMAANGTQVLGKTAEQVAAEEASLTSEIKAAIEATFEYANAQIKAKDSLYALGQALQENGSNFDDNTVKGRANLIALQATIMALQATAGTNKQVLANDLVALQQQMANLGIVSVGATTAINNAIYAATQGTNIVGNAADSTFDWKSLNVGFTTITASAKKAKTALELLDEKLQKIFKGYDRGIEVAAALDDLGESFSENGKVVGKSTAAMRANFNAIKDVISSFKEKSKGNLTVFRKDLLALRASLVKMGVTGPLAFSLIDSALATTKNKAKVNAKQIKTMLDEIFGAFTAAETEKEMDKEVRTISDYVSELQGVLDKAFENRYGKQTAADSIASSWLSIKDAVDAAKQSITDAKLAIDSLNADKSVLEYQLKVAIKYGDTLRAQSIQAKLAETNSKLAEESTKLSEAQSDASLTLDGNSKAAIENRQKVRDLVQANNAYLLSLASTGVSSADLEVEAKKLAADFMEQGKNIGFAESELKSYADAFSGDFINVLKGLEPYKVITPTFNGDPALAAIAEFVAKSKALLAEIQIPAASGGAPQQVDTSSSVSTSAPSSSGGTPAVATPVKTTPSWVAAAEKQIATLTKTANTAATQLKTLQAEQKANTSQYNAIKNVTGLGSVASALKTDIAQTASAINWTGAGLQSAKQQIATLNAKLDAAGYASGGFIRGPGTGTSDSIPARLSDGEYVVKANAVKHYGVDFMNALNQMTLQRPASSAVSAGGFGGSSVVYLSPEDRQLLRAASERPITLYTENTRIAASANAGNVVLAQRGTK